MQAHKIGVITNPASSRMLREIDAFRTEMANHPDLIHREITDITEMTAILQDFQAQGVDLIVLNGGDGTVQAAITSALNDQPYDELPTFTILPGGRTNLTAEAMGTRASAKRGGKAKTLRASAGTMSNWIKGAYGVRGIELADHSGLNEDSRVRAEAMVKVLSHAAKGPLKDVLRRHPVGKKGEVKGMEVIAKTGTLNFVRGLVGYLKLENGRVFAFAIYSADLATRRAIPKSERERPRGARSWALRAVRREQAILKRWAALHVP